MECVPTLQSNGARASSVFTTTFLNHHECLLLELFANLSKFLGDLRAFRRILHPHHFQFPNLSRQSLDIVLQQLIFVQCQGFLRQRFNGQEMFRATIRTSFVGVRKMVFQQHTLFTYFSKIKTRIHDGKERRRR